VTGTFHDFHAPYGAVTRDVKANTTFALMMCPPRFKRVFELLLVDNHRRQLMQVRQPILPDLRRTDGQCSQKAK
jgi:hypothetical protein